MNRHKIVCICNVLVKALRKRLGDGYSVIAQDSLRNNGVNGVEIVISELSDEPDIIFDVSNIVLEIDSGVMNVSKAVEMILRECKFIPQVEKEYILSHTVYKLINRQQNAELLESAPHFDFLDLSVIYMMVDSTHEMLITEIICKEYGIDKYDLDKTAYKNTEAKGFIIESVSSLLGEEDAYGSNFVIGTNQTLKYGATILLYPQYFQSASNALNSDLYILPISVHEVEFISTRGIELDDLQTFVEACNLCMTAKDDRLSNSVYRYNRSTKQITIAAEPESQLRIISS